MSAPSPGLLAALEREARAQGVWMVRGAEFKLAGWTMATGEAVEHYTIVGQRPPLGSVGIIRAVEGWPGAGDRWEVEPLTAALWLLARRSGLEVQVGACTACDGPCPDCDAPGDTGCAWCDGTADLGCDVCSDGDRATGVERRPLHEEILAADPDLDYPCCKVASFNCSCMGTPQILVDHEAIDRLAIFADGLMSPLPSRAAQEPVEQAKARHALGQLLSLWLAEELLEEHVLGVETMRHPELEARFDAEDGRTWFKPEGWRWAEPPKTHAWRPTLEARPT